MVVEMVVKMVENMGFLGEKKKKIKKMEVWWLLEWRRRWREDGEKDGGEVGGDGGEGGRPRREARLFMAFAGSEEGKEEK